MIEINTLGFIGLGVMGGPMCGNLTSRSKLPVVAFDAIPASADTCVELGAQLAKNVAEVAVASDVLFYSLPTIDHVESVTEEVLRAPSRPKVIVDMSTSDVSRTRALGTRLAEEGITLVDAPVARLRQAAKDGTLLITVGASSELFQVLKPLLACMGSDIVHAGGLGNGQVMKILNNMIVFQTMNALAEAVAIGQAAGVGPEHLLKTLTLGSADSFLLRKSALATLAVDEYPVKTFPTTYAIKDLSLALDLARDHAVPVRSAEATMSLLEATRDAGYAQEYYPVMVKLLQGSQTPA